MAPQHVAQRASDAPCSRSRPTCVGTLRGPPRRGSAQTGRACPCDAPHEHPSSEAVTGPPPRSGADAALVRQSLQHVSHAGSRYDTLARLRYAFPTDHEVVAPNACDVPRSQGNALLRGEGYAEVSGMGCCGRRARPCVTGMGMVYARETSRPGCWREATMHAQDAAVGRRVRIGEHASATNGEGPAGDVNVPAAHHIRQTIGRDGLSRQHSTYAF